MLVMCRHNGGVELPLDLRQPLPVRDCLLARSVRLLLHRCPNPYHVRDLGVQGIIDLFHDHGARCGPKTAGKIWSCATHSLLSPPDIVAVYVAGLDRLLADEAHWLHRRQWTEARLEAIARATPARHLLSIRGLSPLWAACYLDLVGYPPRFDWADQVRAYVGFDTVLDQSGDDDPRPNEHPHPGTWHPTR
jgi:hypothetical protein